MVFKGFTDVDGNVIPVQGAGTVYNEEKNSLALGKDTVAIGQDQLVFGRKNIEDANKVEVVGAGEYSLFNTVLNAEIGFDFSLEISGTTYQARKWGNTLNEAKQNAAISFNPTLTNIVIDLTGSDLDEDDIAFVVCMKDDYMDYGELLQIFDKQGWRYQPTTVSGTGNTIQFKNISKSVTGRLNPSTGETTANIRTLDWDGTQWNAGDITCDDGNGNTISMRDLLSRIATLEAAAANS